MTMPALAVARGDTLTVAFDLDTDLTGWTPRWTCKALANYADALDAAATLTATLGSGLTVLSAPAGTLTLTIAASVTTLLTPGVYVWDLQLTSGTTVRTVEWDTAGTTVGTLTVTADVTRTTP